MRKNRIRKRIIAAVLATICVLGLIACGEEQVASVATVAPLDDGRIADVISGAEEREMLCLNMIKTDMMTEKGGIRTNYLDVPRMAAVATGDEVLSESMGLYMLYAAEAKDQVGFDSAFGFVERYLETDELISYRFDPDKGTYAVNALVDDFRIIRALLQAEVVFGGGYEQQAMTYADRLYQTNVVNGQLVDYYDMSSGAGQPSGSIMLCYIDLETIRMLGERDARWQAVYQSAEKLVLKGMLDTGFPMFSTSYDYATKRYNDNTINMVEATLTALNLAKVDACPDKTVAWLKSTVANGTLFGAYTRKGRAESQWESTAIYALCAQIACEIGDEDFYVMSLERMNAFQILDTQSEIYGAYADADTLTLYSFDNLMALLALQQRARLCEE